MWPSFNLPAKSLVLGLLINLIWALTDYIFPFQKIRDSVLFEPKLIYWRLGDHPGGRIKSFTDSEEKMCFVISTLVHQLLRRCAGRLTSKSPESNMGIRWCWCVSMMLC